MRRAPFPSRRSATVTLLIVNVAAFLAQVVLSSFLHYPANKYFALSLEGLRHGFVWQLLTYQFMHGGVIHLLLNCWAIFMFGREVEEALGRKSFLMLYFSSGVIGGLVQMLAAVMLRGHFPHFAAPVVGASAGAFGLIAAFAVLFPERPLTILIFFIIPVNMRAKFLLLGSVLLALVCIAFPISNIADAAHLGGMLTGVIFVRYALHWHWPRFRRSPTQRSRPMVRVASRNSALWGQNKPELDEDLPPEEFLSKEVDPILDKISAQGIQSLTERERKVLQAARAKMAKR